MKNSKHVGDRFEQDFMDRATACGKYIQQMPARVGFDFLCGAGGLPFAQFLELKNVRENHLRLRHFTQIEINVAEEMYNFGIPYYVVFPLYGEIGRVAWADIRNELLSPSGVRLDDAKYIWNMNEDNKGCCPD